MAKSNERRSGATIPRADKDPLKRFPSGLRALIRSIRKCWNPAEMGLLNVKRRPLDFAKAFTTTYNNVSARYGRKPKSDAAIKRHMDKLEGNGGETIHINFVDMRALAEYVGDLPTGLFLIYSQCVSEGGRQLEREKQLKFLEHCEQGISALRGHLSITPKDKPAPALIKRVGDRRYVATLEGLRELVKGYRGETLPGLCNDQNG